MQDSIRIYLVEDDRRILHFLQEALLLRPDWKLVGFSDTLADAKSLAHLSNANVFLIDLGLPDGRGEELLAALSQQRPDAELLVFTVFGDESRLIQALQAGATGYVLKGCTCSELVKAIEEISNGGAPISPLLARMLLRSFRTPQSETKFNEADQDSNVLSEREVQVLQLLAQGYLNKEIAKRLQISPTTVNTHVKKLYRKMAVHNRVQVVMAAQERGLI